MAATWMDPGAAHAAAAVVLVGRSQAGLVFPPTRAREHGRVCHGGCTARYNRGIHMRSAHCSCACRVGWAVRNRRVIGDMGAR